MAIHFVSGKGGVGKTSIALALALNAFEKKKKVLFVQIGDLNPASDWLGFDVTETPKPCLFGFDVVAWTGPTCLKEYARWIIKSDKLVKLFFENKVSNSLIQVAPGLSELAILGKATSGYRKVGYPLDYDEIIIDSYATGHFLALFQAPISFSTIFKIGPMATQTASMLKVLKNPEMTHYYFVALPESLVIQETIELVNDFKSLLEMEPTLILNQYIAPSKNLNQSHFDSYLAQRFEYQSYAQKKYPNILCTPWVPHVPSRVSIEKISKAIHVF